MLQITSLDHKNRWRIDRFHRIHQETGDRHSLGERLGLVQG